MSDVEDKTLLVIRKRHGASIGGICGALFMMAGLGFVFFLAKDVLSLSDFLSYARSDVISAFVLILTILTGPIVLIESIRQIFWGPTITLSPAGFRVRIDGQSGFVGWNDVKAFRVVQPSAAKEAVVGWDYTDNALNDGTHWTGLKIKSRSATALHCDFGSGWKDGSLTVCHTLESWRAQYARPDLASEKLVLAKVTTEAAEHTTLMIRADPLKTLPLFMLGLAAFVGLLGLSIWLTIVMANAGIELAEWADFLDNWIFWFLLLLNAALVLLIGVGAYGLARRFLASPTILLTHDGFDIRDEAGRVSVRWNDVEAFGVAYCTSSHREQVGWRYKPGAGEVQKGAKPADDLDALVGLGWQGSIRNLRHTLDRWRVRYSDC